MKTHSNLLEDAVSLPVCVQRRRSTAPIERARVRACDEGPALSIVASLMNRALGWPLVRSTFSLTLLVGCGALWACGGGGDEAEGGNAKVPQSKRSTEIQHEACEGAGDAVDVNNDGKPDIRHVRASNGRESCRVTDLNRNGIADLFQYFDAAGNLRRREADYDESGVVDAIETYEGGKLVRVEYDTLARHRIDTWDFFDAASGKRVRRERDTKGTGKVDQWWTWEGEKVTIAFDRDGDGQPDPTNTVALGESSGPEAAKDAGPAPSTASQVGSLDAGASPVSAIVPNATPFDAGALPSSKTPDAGAGKKPGAKK